MQPASSAPSSSTAPATRSLAWDHDCCFYGCSKGADCRVCFGILHKRCDQHFKSKYVKKNTDILAPFCGQDLLVVCSSDCSDVAAVRVYVADSVLYTELAKELARQGRTPGWSDINNDANHIIVHRPQNPLTAVFQVNGADHAQADFVVLPCAVPAVQERGLQVLAKVGGPRSQHAEGQHLQRLRVKYNKKYTVDDFCVVAVAVNRDGQVINDILPAVGSTFKVLTTAKVERGMKLTDQAEDLPGLDLAVRNLKDIRQHLQAHARKGTSPEDQALREAVIEETVTRYKQATGRTIVHTVRDVVVLKRVISECNLITQEEFNNPLKLKIDDWNKAIQAAMKTVHPTARLAFSKPVAGGAGCHIHFLFDTAEGVINFNPAGFHFQFPDGHIQRLQSHQVDDYLSRKAASSIEQVKAEARQALLDHSDLARWLRVAVPPHEPIILPLPDSMLAEDAQRLFENIQGAAQALGDHPPEVRLINQGWPAANNDHQAPNPNPQLLAHNPAPHLSNSSSRHTVPNGGPNLPPNFIPVAGGAPFGTHSQPPRLLSPSSQPGSAPAFAGTSTSHFLPPPTTSTTSARQSPAFSSVASAGSMQAAGPGTSVRLPVASLASNGAPAPNSLPLPMDPPAPPAVSYPQHPVSTPLSPFDAPGFDPLPVFRPDAAMASTAHEPWSADGQPWPSSQARDPGSASGDLFDSRTDDEIESLTDSEYLLLLSNAPVNAFPELNADQVMLDLDELEAAPDPPEQFQP